MALGLHRTRCGGVWHCCGQTCEGRRLIKRLSSATMVANWGCGDGFLMPSSCETSGLFNDLLSSLSLCYFACCQRLVEACTRAYKTHLKAWLNASYATPSSNVSSSTPTTTSPSSASPGQSLAQVHKHSTPRQSIASLPLMQRTPPQQQ